MRIVCISLTELCASRGSAGGAACRCLWVVCRVSRCPADHLMGNLAEHFNQTCSGTYEVNSRAVACVVPSIPPCEPGRSTGSHL